MEPVIFEFFFLPSSRGEISRDASQCGRGGIQQIAAYVGR